MNGATLNSVSLHRDLGLLTSDVLSWNLNIANITAKANSILGLIKKSMLDVNDVATFIAYSAGAFWARECTFSY